jgi:hypothetical protein
MNQAVKKLPLMLGVVGAIAFAAATPSWAQEKGSAPAGASAQTKATGSNAKKISGNAETRSMSSGPAASSKGMRGERISGRAASSEGMKTGHMRTSEKTGHPSMRSGRAHLSSKEHLRTRTNIGARESIRTRTSTGLREARFRDRRFATSSVGVGVNAGFADTGFYGYGYGSPGFGYGYGSPGFAAGYGYPAGYGYAAGYPGCTCGAPGVAWGYGSPAYGASYGWGWGGPGYASWGPGWGWGGTQVGVGVSTATTGVATTTGTTGRVSTKSSVRGARVSQNTTAGTVGRAQAPTTGGKAAGASEGKAEGAPGLGMGTGKYRPTK